jgi:pseudouridine synthase
LLTDDGALANVLTHPRYGVEKTYRAIVRGRLTPEQIALLQSGVRLEDGRAEPAQVRVVATRRDQSVIDLTIHEGRNRQVRRMFEEMARPVLELTRLRFGPISLGDLVPGAIRDASAREIATLRTIADAAKERET